MKTLAALLIAISAFTALEATPAFARRGADDATGHVRQGRGKDDAAGHVRQGRGADDAAGHVRHGRGKDDGANHK